MPAKAKILSPEKVEKLKFMNALKKFRKGIGQEDLEKTTLFSLGGRIFAVVADDGEDASMVSFSQDKFVRAGNLDLKMCGS